MTTEMFSADLADGRRADLGRRASLRQAAAKAASDCGGFFSCLWHDVRRRQPRDERVPCPC